MNNVATNVEISLSNAEKTHLEFLWLELTNRCNLQCTHCYSESTPHAGNQDLLTIDDYKTLLWDAKTLGCRQVQFIGGEPTLNKDLAQLISYASLLEYELIEVFTNLLRLDDSLISTLLEYKVSVATSFYSSQKLVHDKITQQIGSFDKTVANINRVLASGLKLRVGIIEMQENSGEFERTAEFLRNLGVTSISLDYVRHFGRANSGEIYSMSELCGKCSRNILAVGSDGIIAPCIMSKQWALGSALLERLTDVARSARTAATRNEIALAATHLTNQHSQHGVLSSDCIPECSPSSHCIPCAPNGGHKCQPNNWCSPAQ